MTSSKLLGYQLHHLIKVLETHSLSSSPVLALNSNLIGSSTSFAFDKHINNYFREHDKSLGSKDRAFIAENSYAYLRWKLLVERLTMDRLNDNKKNNSSNDNALNDNSKNINSPSMGEQLITLFNLPPSMIFHPNQAELKPFSYLPIHVQVSFPENLFSLISNFYGPEQAVQLCLDSNTQAPLTIRGNSLKISRDDLLNKWHNLDIEKSNQHINENNRDKNKDNQEKNVNLSILGISYTLDGLK